MNGCSPAQENITSFTQPNHLHDDRSFLPRMFARPQLHNEGEECQDGFSSANTDGVHDPSKYPNKPDARIRWNDFLLLVQTGFS